MSAIASKYRLPVYLSLALCALLCLTMNFYGIAADEQPYYNAGNAYATWLTHPTWHHIDSYWQSNHEHPPFGKLVGGVSSKFFHETLGTVGAFKSFRIQNLVYCFVISLTAFFWTAELTNRKIATVAVLMIFVLPRIFFEAHIGSLDYPLTALTFVTAFAFWKSLTKPAYLWLASALAGLVILTKINGVFLFAFLTVWLLIAWRHDMKDRWPSIVLFATLPVIMFFGFWPWLWPHPVARSLGYFLWMKDHYPIPAYYLGRCMLHAPWHYPFVLTLATVPLAILAATTYYFVVARKTRVHWFIIINVALPIALIAFLSPCKNSGVRLFLPAFPFLCILAALGIHEYLSTGTKLRVALVACAGVGTVLFAFYEYGRYQECYYNEAVVLSRANSLFETEYEGVPRQEISLWLEERQSHNYAVLVMQESLFSTSDWDIYRHTKPVYAIREANGQPIACIYTK